MRVEPFLADTFSRRSRSFWRRISRRCVWANSTEIVLTPICGCRSRAGPQRSQERTHFCSSELTQRVRMDLWSVGETSRR
jgi:hypothetical protein